MQIKVRLVVQTHSGTQGTDTLRGVIEPPRSVALGSC